MVVGEPAWAKMRVYTYIYSVYIYRCVSIYMHITVFTVFSEV